MTLFHGLDSDVAAVCSKILKTVNRFDTLPRADVVFIVNAAIREVAEERLMKGKDRPTMAEMAASISKAFDIISSGGVNIGRAKKCWGNCNRVGYDLWSMKQRFDELARRVPDYTLPHMEFLLLSDNEWEFRFYEDPKDVVQTNPKYAREKDIFQ